MNAAINSLDIHKIPVSVIVFLNSNYPKRIEHCIKSLLAQTLMDLEIILILPPHTNLILNEGIREAVLQTPKTIVFLENSDNALSTAYNLGINHAQGAYLAFLESDDWVEPNAYEKLYEYAVQSKCDVIKSKFYYRDDKVDYIHWDLAHLDEVIVDKSKIGSFLGSGLTIWNAIYNSKKIKESGIYFHKDSPNWIVGLFFSYSIYCHFESFYFISDFFLHYTNSNRVNYTYSRKNYFNSLIVEHDRISKIVIQRSEFENLASIFIQHEANQLLAMYLKTKFNLRYLYKISKQFKKRLSKSKITRFTFISENDYKTYFQLANKPQIFLFADIRNRFLNAKYKKKLIVHLEHQYAYSQKYLFSNRYVLQQASVNNIEHAHSLALVVQKQHNETFSEFKNINTGKDVVVVAPGPTLKKYVYNKDMIHIGVNSVIQNAAIPLDYFFACDYAANLLNMEYIKKAQCIKFIGQALSQFWFGEATNRMLYRQCSIIFPESFIHESKSRLFYRCGGLNPLTFIDMANSPLPSLPSVIFCAIQFALYTNPRKLYLAGCDVSNAGYSTNNNPNFMDIDSLVKVYCKIKEIKNVFYPNIEIVSINPVSLKGLFTDQYAL